MKTIVALSCALVLFVPCVLHATDTRSADREQIIQLERDWTQAFVTNDAAANDRVVADDYLGTEPSGKRMTKADLTADLKSGVVPLASNHLNEDDLTIRF